MIRRRVYATVGLIAGIICAIAGGLILAQVVNSLIEASMLIRLEPT
jgi:hypothetical protein